MTLFHEWALSEFHERLSGLAKVVGFTDAVACGEDLYSRLKDAQNTDQAKKVRAWFNGKRAPSDEGLALLGDYFSDLLRCNGFRPLGPEDVVKLLTGPASAFEKFVRTRLAQFHFGEQYLARAEVEEEAASKQIAALAGTWTLYRGCSHLSDSLVSERLTIVAERPQVVGRCQIEMHPHERMFSGTIYPTLGRPGAVAIVGSEDREDPVSPVLLMIDLSGSSSGGPFAAMITSYADTGHILASTRAVLVLEEEDEFPGCREHNSGDLLFDRYADALGLSTLPSGKERPNAFLLASTFDIHTALNSSRAKNP